MPHEARFHPDYEKLMNRRAEFQDQTFQSLASLGKKTGEFPELSESELKEVIRCLVMGWFFELHFRHAELPGSGDSIA